MARPTLSTHPKFRRLCSLLKRPAYQVRGLLEYLWENTAYDSGNEHVGDEHDVEAAALWDGEPGELCAALAAAGGPGRAGFIEPSRMAGTWRIHDLWDHAPDYVRRRRSREQERKDKGKRLSGRSRKGRKGSQDQAGQAFGSDQPVTGQRPARDRRAPVSDQSMVNTPAPAPAPAPAQEETPRGVSSGPPLLPGFRPASPEAPSRRVNASQERVRQVIEVFNRCGVEPDDQPAPSLVNTWVSMVGFDPLLRLLADLEPTLGEKDDPKSYVYSAVQREARGGRHPAARALTPEISDERLSAYERMERESTAADESRRGMRAVAP